MICISDVTIILILKMAAEIKSIDSLLTSEQLDTNSLMKISLFE